MEAALELGFPCGGWCPAGRLAEDGKVPEQYPVVQLDGAGYGERTARNVADSDGTLIVAHGPLTGGTRETLERCIEMHKPHFVIDLQTTSTREAIAQALEFARTVSARANARNLSKTEVVNERPRSYSPRKDAGFGMTTVLNIAGPRASQWPDGHSIAHQIVSAVLRRLSGHNRADEYSA